MLVRRSISRRYFVRTGAAGAVFMPAVLRSSLGFAQAKKLTVMSVGGSWGTAIKEMIGDPLAKQEGAMIAYDQRPNAQQVAALQAMRGSPTVRSSSSHPR